MIYEEVFRYIIGVIINDNNKIRAVTNALPSAKAEYKVLVDKYSYDTENSIKVYLFVIIYRIYCGSTEKQSNLCMCSSFLLYGL